MRYCSIDIETTGLNHETTDILQFAAILDDLSDQKPIESLPVLNICFVKEGPLSGDPYAFAMHKDLLLRIDSAKRKRIKEDDEGCRYMTVDCLPEALNGFLFAHGWTPDPKTERFYINVAGKNAAGFDLPYLRAKVKNWGRVKLMQRVLDPAILYFDPAKDASLPDLQLCLDRAGIKGTVSHTANKDAYDVIRLLRHKYGKNP